MYGPASQPLQLAIVHVLACQVAITTRVIELVHEILTKRIHTTKRDLFYCDPKLFVDQVPALVVMLSTLHGWAPCWQGLASAPGAARRHLYTGVDLAAVVEIPLPRRACVLCRLCGEREQTESDTILDDVACMASCTRTSLHVVASEKVRVSATCEAPPFVFCLAWLRTAGSPMCLPPGATSASVARMVTCRNTHLPSVALCPCDVAGR